MHQGGLITTLDGVAATESTASSTISAHLPFIARFGPTVIAWFGSARTWRLQAKDSREALPDSPRRDQYVVSTFAGHLRDIARPKSGESALVDRKFVFFPLLPSSLSSAGFDSDLSDAPNARLGRHFHCVGVLVGVLMIDPRVRGSR